MNRPFQRGGVLLVLLLAASPFLALAAQKSSRESPTGAKEPGEVETLTGKVVPVADLVAQAGSKLDADAAPYWLALVTANGKVYPLVKDPGGRMFFQNKTLHNRPMRLTGRLLPGSQLFRVLSVRSLIRGESHEVYYWCDVCSIRRNEQMDCECCGAPMELREEPVKK